MFSAFRRNRLAGAGAVCGYVPARPTVAEGKWTAGANFRYRRSKSDSLLGTAYHWPSERTTLSVFDAQAVNAGPVASVTLTYGLPLGLHGQFVPA